MPEGAPAANTRRAYGKATWAFVLGLIGLLIPPVGVVALFLGQAVEDDIDGDPRWKNAWMATTAYYLGLIATLVLSVVLFAIVLSALM